MMSNDTIAQRKAHAIEKLTNDRDAAIKRAEAAEAAYADLIESNREQAEAIATLRAERDALHADMVQCVSDARKMAADLYHAQNERDEARRELLELRHAIVESGTR